MSQPNGDHYSTGFRGIGTSQQEQQDHLHQMQLLQQQHQQQQQQQQTNQRSHAGAQYSSAQMPHPMPSYQQSLPSLNRPYGSDLRTEPANGSAKRGVPDQMAETHGVIPSTKKQRVDLGAKPSTRPSAATTKSASVANGNRQATPSNDSLANLPNQPQRTGEALGQEEIVSLYLELQPPPSMAAKLPSLDPVDVQELEHCLGIGVDEQWRDDWIGNLAFLDQDVANPDQKSKAGPKKPFLRWAENTRSGLKMINYLLRHVYHLPETPKQARHILANADRKSVDAIQNAVRRVSYDPIVLRQDGWTTQKTTKPIGASGGPHRIGEKVFWQNYEGVVIAYIHDHDLGDLWKAMWFDEFDTFDLEAEELENARKKYLRRQNPPAQRKQNTKEGRRSATSSPVPSETIARSRSARYAATADFSVNGVEHGIVLAVSYARGARPGVYWPARIMHASEMTNMQSKRGTQKQKVDVIFLAPYWNSAHIVSSGRRVVESYHDSLSRRGGSLFNTGPLFELESVGVGADSIQEYPYDGLGGLDIDQLRVAFKFVGLPKAAFQRYVDAHRLALSLKTFSQTRMNSDTDKTTAGLFEVHPLSVQTALYPPAVLQLPFDHILSQMPQHSLTSGNVGHVEDQSNDEPSIKLAIILDSMKPPASFGVEGNHISSSGSADAVQVSTASAAPRILLLASQRNGAPIKLDTFIQDLPKVKELMDGKSRHCQILKASLEEILDLVPENNSALASMDLQAKRLGSARFTKAWAFAKSQGEDVMGASLETEMRPVYLAEWRKVCERLYKYYTLVLSTLGYGNGLSTVFSDSLCNQHLTTTGCFERAVRIPAALKAAKKAFADTENKIQLILSVDKEYLELAEKKVIRKAHSRSYLKRIKNRCMSIPPDKEIVPLTEDSDGNGGEDTKGSRGTWTAALASVGAAIKGVDMIIRGECVNGFCITRPPGHHAGRELHPMKAVSNGFCILNAAACAALYATTSVIDGGIGLKRVCVIDIDVHHGNGTQDILCSTYDPRFLYVSIHAGGAHVNGVDLSDEGDVPAHHLGRPGAKGIYPGRCGDTSPHDGVLNIPLGAKVTPYALGTAMITKVKPAVVNFAPDMIILSTGFDAHKNDPLGLGGLSSKDFGTLTEVICQIAHKTCGGRVLSILEGGYGVPCCRPPENLFLPPDQVGNKSQDANSANNAAAAQTGNNAATSTQPSSSESNSENAAAAAQLKPVQLLDLGDELPDDMADPVSHHLSRRLEKCHADGFMHCVEEHVRTLAKCNTRQ